MKHSLYRYTFVHCISYSEWPEIRYFTATASEYAITNVQENQYGPLLKGKGDRLIERNAPFGPYWLFYWPKT
jgi:hypothetical protein